MKNFLKKQREILILFAYAGLIAALVYFFILPLLSRIQGVDDQIQEKSLKQEIVNKQLEELPKFHQQYDTLGENENLVDILLDKGNAVVLIERLEKLAEDTKNKITISVTAQAPVVTKASAASAGKTKTEPTLADSLPSTDYLQMKIVLIGNYNTIYNFIDLLESFEYYSDIIGIQIGQNADKSNPAAYIGMFGSPAAGSADKERTISDSVADDLTASLDAVFYTKK